MLSLHLSVLSLLAHSFVLIIYLFIFPFSYLTASPTLAFMFPLFSFSITPPLSGSSIFFLLLIKRPSLIVFKKKLWNSWRFFPWLCVYQTEHKVFTTAKSLSKIIWNPPEWELRKDWFLCSLYFPITETIAILHTRARNTSISRITQLFRYNKKFRLC